MFDIDILPNRFSILTRISYAESAIEPSLFLVCHIQHNFPVNALSEILTNCCYKLLSINGNCCINLKVLNVLIGVYCCFC